MATDPFPGTIGNTVADSGAWWPPRPGAAAKRPNLLVVLFDDVGFSDLGCYGSTIRTPAIDALAARGLRLTGFHTTAMCSTTRAALPTGCNHHRVGMGCLANFDSGFPGYRGKIAPEAATLAEMLRPHGYVNYMLGKWHVTPLNETGPTGPFDGWPLGRGYDRYYGFMDAGTLDSPHGFDTLISWSGLDIGLDRGSPVSHLEAPFAFTGRLRQVTVTLDAPAGLDGEALGQVEMARQ
ncbi:MAG: sulfatase-like hydrolase/transferase [Burkholderiaceae bacterium]|nr:sulfatase-like hydrolase/transferase [Burkholderiaceae bacterium]